MKFLNKAKSLSPQAKKVIAAFAVLILGFGSYKWFSRPSSEEKAEGRKGRGGGGGAPLPVRVAPAAKQVSPRVLEMVVTLEGRQQADVYSKATGRVRTIRVKDGQKISRNQIVGELDRNDPGESFLNMPLQSPIDGYVGRIISTIGAQVTAQDPIMTVLDDTYLRAEVFIPVEDWSFLQAGSKVAAEWNTEKREGKILAIARAADAATGRGSFTVEFENANRSWKSGMIVHLKVEIDPKERIILPTSALSVTDTGSFLFVADKDQAQRIAISSVLLTNDTFEVTNGLKGGENVILEGTNRLFPGAKIKIVTTEEGMAE